LGGRQENPELGPLSLATIQASDANGVAKIEYSVDGKTFQEYTRSIPLRLLDNAVVQYRAIDILGNVSPKQDLSNAGDIAPR